MRQGRWRHCRLGTLLPPPAKYFETVTEAPGTIVLAFSFVPFPLPPVITGAWPGDLLTLYPILSKAPEPSLPWKAGEA